MATGRYFIVGFGYAAGVAMATVIAGLVVPRSDPDWLGVLLQFVSVFMIVSVPSLMTSGVCVLLKWEDNRARRKYGPPVESDPSAEPGDAAAGGSDPGP